MHTPEVIEKRRKRISEAHKRGAYKEGYIKSGQTRTGKKASDEAKRNISIAAQNSPHQRVCKRSHEFIDKQGRKYIFDSSWEDLLAIRLDFLDIKWDRPLPISYEMNGKKYRYFPDFYIPSLNLYIDPKNPYCQKQQKQKLDIVSKMINLQILGSKKECVEWRAEQDLNLRPTA